MSLSSSSSSLQSFQDQTVTPDPSCSNSPKSSFVDSQRIKPTSVRLKSLLRNLSAEITALRSTLRQKDTEIQMLRLELSSIRSFLIETPVGPPEYTSLFPANIDDGVDTAGDSGSPPLASILDGSVRGEGYRSGSGNGRAFSARRGGAGVLE
ncbi:hypothetical protein RUND412_007336 [Rhizina undulata]